MLTQGNISRLGENTTLKCGVYDAFGVSGLVLSYNNVLMCPVLWPFCPVLCPFCPSHKRLKFAGNVLFLLRSRSVNMTKSNSEFRPIGYFRYIKIQLDSEA